MHENLDVESPMIDLTDCQPKIREKTLTEAEKRKLRKVAMAKIEDAAMRNIEKIRKNEFSSEKRSQIGANLNRFLFFFTCQKVFYKIYKRIYFSKNSLVLILKASVVVVLCRSNEHFGLVQAIVGAFRVNPKGALASLWLPLSVQVNIRTIVEPPARLLGQCTVR